MKQYEAVIKVMEENEGFATLGYLYEHVLRVPNCVWKTKTPYASIRRIVQDSRFFFNIKPGLWALNSQQEAVLKRFSLDHNGSPQAKKGFGHTYYQGLLVEIGNLEGFQTFVPNQDKNRLYLSSSLVNYVTATSFFNFTYDYLLRRARTIDVTWFNNRKFPASFFEVEHTTDMQNSLLKFLEFQDFNVRFGIVASQVRQREFEQKASYTAFAPIKHRVRFFSYEKVSNYHAKAFELNQVKQGILF